jgi:predicted TIM-barrel fold metal-dependent hydrolase
VISDTPLARAFWQDGRCRECPVIDMHGHLGDFYGIWFPRAAVEAMVQTMDQAGVRLLCLCPHASLFMPDVGNAALVEAVRQYPDRLRGYLAMNPNYPEQMARDLARYAECADALAGLKVLPDYHRTAMDDAAYAPAWEFADARGLLVLAHTWGGSVHNGEAQVRAVAGRYPRTKLLMGHSLHGAWDAAIAIAKEFPNVYLELTAVLDDRGVVEQFVAAGLSQRILFGTDNPWFHPHHGIGTLLSADITDDDRHNILHRNAEKLLAGADVYLT